ncbi:MAG: bacteriohemerythrin [Proteobacteria bacterium]|nr:bacteriohemerythrin [Pseudomonadota bacterium]MBU1596279.1 bacteriohemerythrin [Pseudomonadota bacterium]
MAQILWTESLSVGIREIDEQHKVLIEMINELSTLTSTDEKNSVVPSVISRLVNYTRDHFSFEEGLLGKVSDQHGQRHKGEHAAFISKIEDYMEACGSGYTPYADLVEYLREYWLVQHIEQVDKELGRLLSA